MIPSLWNKVVNFIETKGRRVLPGAGGRSNGELAFNGYGVSVLQDEFQFCKSKVDGADGCSTM